eukprot:10361870-Heterocapsa_arctica.AAC.1
MDLFLGARDGRLRYFERQADGSLVERTDADANPFRGVHMGSNSKPAFGDLDNDGDLDFVLAGGGEV